MILRIISKEKEILNKEVPSVTLPGSLGQMQILPGHTKLITILKKGQIENINFKSGLARVSNNQVTVLIDQ